MNTKNSTKRQLCRLVEYLVFNLIYLKKSGSNCAENRVVSLSAEGLVEHQLISVPSDEVYCVADGGPDHAVVIHIDTQGWKFRRLTTSIEFKI